MLHKIVLFLVIVFVLAVLNAPLDAAAMHTLAGWAQSYSGSLISLSLAMLTLIPALLTIGSGPAEAISALSFTLFFWGRFQQTHDPLPLVLFAIGGVFLAIEFLLIPGLGKPFLIGTLCLSAAILKSYPVHEQGMQALLLAYSSVGAGLWFALKFLPRNPLTSRLLALKPPTAEESRFQPGSELLPLVGAVGEAVTALRPSGKAFVNGKTLGVRAEGAFVEAGCRVRVLRVEANQLIVEPVE